MALLRTLDDKIRISVDENQTLIVGRLEECGVVLSDDSVSSQHARLHLENHILHLKDLHSTNGTRVNYARIDTPTVLLDGDTVEFGNVTFTVDAPELCSPAEDSPNDPPEALTSLEPIKEPLDSTATMRLGDLHQTDSEQDFSEAPTLERINRNEDSDPDDSETDTQESPPLNPVLASFAVSLVLILLAFGLMLLVVKRVSGTF